MDNNRNAKKVRPIIRLDYKAGSLVEPKLSAVLGECLYWHLEENIKDVVISAMRTLKEKSIVWHSIEARIKWIDPDSVTSENLEVLYYWIVGLEDFYPVKISNFKSFIKDNTHNVEIVFEIERVK